MKRVGLFGRSGGEEKPEKKETDLIAVTAVVPFFRLDKVRAALSRFQRTAKRAKQPFSFEVGRVTEMVRMLVVPPGVPYPSRPSERARFMENVPAAIVKAQGIRVPRIRGWRMIGKLEPVISEKSDKSRVNLVHQIDDRFPVPFQKYQHRVGECDHCKTKRDRNATFVMRNEETGVEKVVGRNCLGEFLQTDDAEALVENAALLEELLNAEKSDADQEDLRGASAFVLYDTNEVLEMAAYVARQRGFLSNSAARERSQGGEEGVFSTADVVGDLLTRRPRALFRSLLDGYEGRPAIEEARDRKVVDETRAMFAAMPSTSNYVENSKILLGNTYNPPSAVNYLVSTVGAYLLDQKKKIEASNRAAETSNFLGNVNESVYIQQAKLVHVETLTFVVERGRHDVETTSFLHIFVTPTGDKVIWKASSVNLAERVGETMSVLGTVKAHRTNDRTGQKETILTRAKVDVPAPAPKKSVKSKSEEDKAKATASRTKNAANKYGAMIRDAILWAHARDLRYRDVWNWPSAYAYEPGSTSTTFRSKGHPSIQALDARGPGGDQWTQTGVTPLLLVKLLRQQVASVTKPISETGRLMDNRLFSKPSELSAIEAFLTPYVGKWAENGSFWSSQLRAGALGEIVGGFPAQGVALSARQLALKHALGEAMRWVIDHDLRYEYARRNWLAPSTMSYRYTKDKREDLPISEMVRPARELDAEGKISIEMLSYALYQWAAATRNQDFVSITVADVNELRNMLDPHVTVLHNADESKFPPNFVRDILLGGAGAARGRSTKMPARRPSRVR